jgi:hypothetical protein
MKSRTLIISLLLMCCVPSANALNLVEAIVNDFDELKEAINEANERPLDTATIFYFQSPILVPNDDSLPPIRARVNFEVGEFIVEEGGPARFIQIESTGILGIRDMSFSGWEQHKTGPVLFENHGNLTLRRVNFDTVIGYSACVRYGCNENDTAVIENMPEAYALLESIRVYDQDVKLVGALNDGPQNRFLYNQGRVDLVRTEFYLSHERVKAPIFNSGRIEIENSSFMVADSIAGADRGLIASAEGATTQAVNSVFDGYSGGLCDAVTSLGHNTVSRNDCHWSSPGDMTGVRTGLMWRTYQRSGKQKALIPSAASPLIDSADPNYCSTDGRTIWDGNSDGVAACDRGAWELEPTSLAEGGINGFYYNPSDDGHYIYIQETDFTTLVMWNTFDSEGNQAWIYGTGTLESGKAIVAEAYINRAGGLTPDGLIADVEAKEWGHLIVDMESCTNGLIDYQSVLPEFGSGQFPIERLAYVKQLGCNDPK